MIPREMQDIYIYTRWEKALVLEMTEEGYSSKDIALKIRNSEDYAPSIASLSRRLIKSLPELFDGNLSNINGTYLSNILEQNKLTQYRVSKDQKTATFCIYNRVTKEKVKFLTKEFYQSYILVKQFVRDQLL